MLQFLGGLPLDYSLCCDTVTVYHREGLTRQVLSEVHFEQTLRQVTEGGITRSEHGFLLVVPYRCGLQPGDRVSFGEETFTVESVQERTFQGRFAHVEARG